MQNKLSVFIGTLRVNQGVTTPSTNGFSVANVIRVTSGARSRRSILNSVAGEHGSNSHVPLRLTAVPFFNYFHAKPIYWTLRAAPLSCRRENRSQVRSAWGSVERFHHKRSERGCKCSRSPRSPAAAPPLLSIASNKPPVSDRGGLLNRNARIFRQS